MASTGLYTITTRAPGTIITALIYNGDHQAHVDGRTAELMSGYSNSLSQMQVITDPFPSGAENLAVSLSGELERLRFVISNVKSNLQGGLTPARWYSTVFAPGFVTTGARLQRNPPIAVLNNTLTSLDFTGNNPSPFNTGVWNAGAPTRFTAPANGIYAVGASIFWESASGSSRRTLQVNINGAGTQAIMVNVIPVSNTFQSQALNAIVKLNATDFVEFVVLQDSGGTINITNSSSQSIIGYMVFLSKVPV